MQMQKYVNTFFSQVNQYHNSVKPAFQIALNKLITEMPQKWNNKKAIELLYNAIWDSGKVHHSLGIALNNVYFSGRY